MLAIKAEYDGKNVILSNNVTNMKPGPVIVVFEEKYSNNDPQNDWVKLQEEKFAEVWDNDEDAVYDKL